MSRVSTKVVTITKTDASKQIVYGEVYAPFVMDTEGEFMFPEGIEKMAHDFLRLKLDEVIDTNHDRVANGSYPVESFIAREGDPDFTPGAWVLGVKCSDATWAKVESGDLNSFSFEAMVYPVEVEIEVDTYRDHFGVTQKSATPEVADHDHLFFVYVDEMGKVVKGFTDEVDGHRHVIRGGSRTAKAADASGVLHSHPYAL